MDDRIGSVVDRLKGGMEAVVAPLRKNPESNSFRLSSPDTHTTTIDGDIGWADRPTAVVECGRCGAEIVQRNAHDAIDCPRCVASFSHDEFSTLRLERMGCPVCGDDLEYGRRHPNAFDVPEWATCHSCRYHWEFGHSY
jgi:hypothetical protein